MTFKNTHDYSVLVGNGVVNSLVYQDERIFKDEMKKIFHDGWSFVAHESEIPDVGDYVRRSIGGEPYLVVRNRAGEINILSNKCTHRGTLLCQQEKGNVRGAITCWYHGWVFGLEGELKSIPYEAGSTGLDHQCLPQATVGNYKGFIFATLNSNPIDFMEYLGDGASLIDRAVECSPVQKIRLSSGWAKFLYKTNWKLQCENNIDGYHVNYVHASLARSIESRYNEAVLAEEERLKTTAVDWGNGHSELFLAAGFESDLEWLGYSDAKPLKPFAVTYRDQLFDAYEESRAARIVHDGPPHALIFPNLFLAETNIVYYEVNEVGQTVQRHTPMLLEGVSDEINARIIRLCEAALGPTSFFLPDDGVITERQQSAFRGEPMNIDLRRGLGRENRNGMGVMESHVTDEVTNRAFWNRYRKIMTA